jgi:hypothetical protein
MWKSKVLLVGLSWAGVYLVYSVRRARCRKTLEALRKELGVDTLSLNRMLTFGISKTTCLQHSNNEFDCPSLDCNYGRLRYIINPIYFGL